MSTEHLLVALAAPNDGSAASRLLSQHDVTKDRIYEALAAVRGAQLLVVLYLEVAELRARRLDELVPAAAAGRPWASWVNMLTACSRSAAICNRWSMVDSSKISPASSKAAIWAATCSPRSTLRA